MSAGRRRLAIALGLALVGALLVRARHSLPRVVLPVLGAVTGRRTLVEVLAAHGPAAGARLAPRFERAGVSHPPDEVALLGFKEERRLELWARSGSQDFRRVHAWEVLAASGAAGPKLREGDRQVPEGLYRVVGLNPDSRFHLSLELDYPNTFDRDHAHREGRDPGGEIFVHGGRRSVGCLAIGDEAIEELFVLAARVGPEHLRVVIAPRDPRGGTGARGALEPPPGAPPWTGELYRRIEVELESFASRER